MSGAAGVFITSNRRSGDISNLGDRISCPIKQRNILSTSHEPAAYLSGRAAAAPERHRAARGRTSSQKAIVGRILMLSTRTVRAQRRRAPCPGRKAKTGGRGETSRQAIRITSRLPENRIPNAGESDR
ncbi:hypothetical protein EVAR_76289_1 [Eumeta japonica]|uniref:Uncharacterized protein n=1 Tax=Eumeta variegata TaxID=151549 RepID=A0A4C1UQS4_EUMVA|nr:hypothetical protein EVAR_76289_1 [Eumeta japonica]